MGKIVPINIIYFSSLYYIMMNHSHLPEIDKQKVFQDLITSINQLVGAIKGDLEINQEDAIINLNSITQRINNLDD